MLILTRKPGEDIYIGDGIVVTVVDIKGNQARIGIQASRDVKIYRGEIFQQIQEENRAAAAAGGMESLIGLTNVLPQAKQDAAKQDGVETKRGLAGFSTVKVSDASPMVVKRKKKDEQTDE